MDDLAILINDKITRRGRAKDLVFIQEDLNNNYVRLATSFIIVNKMSFSIERHFYKGKIYGR